MLKWTVYGKKNQESRGSSESENEPSSICNNEFTNHNRKSFDGQAYKKSKKPSRYQRRSLNSNTTRKTFKTIDKENVNYIGSTPNFYKEGFIQKSEGLALKDVSNITPTSGTPVKSFDRRKPFLGSSKDDISVTPSTYSRRVREAKKRKLEMGSTNDSFKRDSITYKSERSINPFERNSRDFSKLTHSSSEPSLHELSYRVNALTNDSNNSIHKKQLINNNINNNNVCTTKPINEGIVEIEYDKDFILNCVEKPITINKSQIERTTLPIFGHHIFMNNPLYFNKNDGIASIRPLKRTRKKSNDFESSFKSPSVDKKDVHTLVRDACSPVSITPLATKLAALRFSTISTRSISQRLPYNDDVTEYFPKVENPFTIPLRDEESSTEMENKFIFSKDLAASRTESTVNGTQSTVSTTQMGDVTLDKMIEDIIKSTKIVKSKRKILKTSPSDCQMIKEEIPQIELVKDLFVNPQAENKANLIKEAKYVNLSRENSISPKATPAKKKKPVQVVNEKLLKNLPVGCFILDDGEGYHEREVKTPENIIRRRSLNITADENRSLTRTQSMHMSVCRQNLKTTLSESTPDLYSTSENKSLKLKRQKCIRRKKSTVSNESLLKPQLTEQKQTILTLEIGIPSPATVLPDVSMCEPLTSPLAVPLGIVHENHSLRSNVSHSSLMMHQQNLNRHSQELFGLTLESGIPSPITPVPNLKRPSKVLSEERAHKTCKVDEELISTNANTPIIEHKSIRRCLTFSPEEYSISSSDEKRRSVASNRLERSSDRFQAPKGTIDLEIVTRNDVIDVHVIRCRDLQRPAGKTDEINAYAKVVISGVPENQSLPSQRSIFQRTSVLYGKREPEFQRHLRLPLPTTVYEHQLLHISVWHRDKKYRRSEFLGCVSFQLKDAIECDIKGTYFLQQNAGRGLNAAPLAHERAGDRVAEVERPKMATDNIETSTNDGTKENHNDKGVTNGPSATTASQAQAVAAALQREADEHLFLRYLELDPPDDPSAPRRPQRNGRTPFTTTRKLLRGTAGGFGFTVVWTRPPRVERVAQGGSAERAGLRAGDYIVFVGSKNVVTASEEEVRNLVKSAGQILQLETFRRVPPNGVGVRPRLAQVSIPPPESTPPPPPRSPRGNALASPATAARPPTACSSTSQSLDRRKLHLPQVTFSKETPGLSRDGRKRALLAVVAREQHYATCLQFGLVRFVSPLAERADLITPSDHQLLFQNLEEIFRLSEDILDQVVQDDGEIQTSTVVAVYLQKTPVFLSLYKKYCLGLKRADCVLVKKSKDPSGAFSRFCTSPPIPRRRPDITSLVHKPLEQFRELLRLMRTAASATGAGPYDQLEKKQLQLIVEQLQGSYQDVTAGSGLMGLAGDGKPLLSVADLESRLVFTRCKPFVLSTAGRQWIFGGELSRVEGRAVRPYWALLFSDLLLFATVSRDRVLFVTEEPVALGAVSEAQFNLRKKVTEFRLILGRVGGESPLVSCAPRTPGRTRTLVLRAPSIDLKAVWQSLLQRQIYRAHTMSGTPLGSPLDSPDPQLTFSLATLDSQLRQTRRSSAETQTAAGGSAVDVARSIRSKGSSQHLQRWMTQLPETEELDPPEPDVETWSVEELRKRSKELNLLEVAELVVNHESKGASPSEKKENDRSPSKSSNSGSQITVRTSPVVVDTIPVCRQCHKKCLSKPNSPLISQKEPPVIPVKPKKEASPQNSNSTKSSRSPCSANYSIRKPKIICGLERKGAIKLRPEDGPKAAMKVIDSIEQSQRMLKSKSYELKTDSPILNRSIRSRSQTKSQLELRKDGSFRTPSPSSSSRNSPLSTSHTTCSSMVFNSSSNDLRMSNSNIANQVQCVIAQEKYINEVKCVENITVTRTRASTNHAEPTSAKEDQLTRQKAENVLNKVLGMNIVAKRENLGSCLQTSSVFLDDDSIHEEDIDFKIERGLRRSPRIGTSVLSKMNGDITNKTEKSDSNVNLNTSEAGSDEDLELGPLMLMGLSAINPTAHLMRVEPFNRSSVTAGHNPGSRPGSLCSIKSESPVPNIAVVPPTPDFNFSNKTDDHLDESPDSPDIPEDLPYVSLKRYGTMSSLERLPSDETDDGNVRLTAQEPEAIKTNSTVVGAAGGIMGWTARAGSFVVEKMNIFSYTESVPNTAVAHKQPSFLERCLGVSDWKSTIGTEEGTGETGEGSGASGEEAWGTPSSGDLSDNLPDSDHGTLSSSSSYAGDDDTELMMDELLMAPTITGPTTLRPLLPRDVFRRRLEPLLEEEFSDSGSEDNKPTPTNSDDQGSGRGLDADVCCDAPHRPPSASGSAEGGGADAAPVAGGEVHGGDEFDLSPDRTPTNEVPSTPLQYVSKEFAEVRATASAGGRRDSASSASTPSTLDRTTIHNPTTLPQQSPVLEPAPVLEVSSQPERPLTPERLSPRAEMRLALDQGTDMLAEQEASWGGGSGRWSFRAACQKSLLRRVASADAVALCRAPPHRTAPHTTSRSSVYAWKDPESETKTMEMEELARVEAQMMRSRTRSLCQNGKIRMGFLRRRASSDSPRREPLDVGRPFSPRRTHVSSNGYYKICFVNGYV